MVLLVIGFIVLVALVATAAVLVGRARRAARRPLIVRDDFQFSGNVRILRNPGEVREAARQACERERQLAQYSQRRAERFECLAYLWEEPGAAHVVGTTATSKLAPPLNV